MFIDSNKKCILKIHIKIYMYIYDRMSLYWCKICDYYGSNNAMKSHELSITHNKKFISSTETDIVKQVFKCDKCSKYFDTFSDMNDHQKANCDKNKKKQSRQNVELENMKLKIENESLKNQIYVLTDHQKFIQSVMIKSRKSYKDTISLINHSLQNYQNAPKLLLLFGILEDFNEHIYSVNKIINYYKDDKLIKHIGDIITKEYKKNSKYDTHTIRTAVALISNQIRDSMMFCIKQCNRVEKCVNALHLIESDDENTDFDFIDDAKLELEYDDYFDKNPDKIVLMKSIKSIIKLIDSGDFYDNVLEYVVLCEKINIPKAKIGCK